MVSIQIGKATRNNKRPQSIKTLIDLCVNLRNTRTRTMDLISEGRIKAEAQRGEGLRDACWSKKIKVKSVEMFPFFPCVLNKN